MRSIGIAALLVAIVSAQVPTATPPTGSISGVVKDAATGKPIATARVRTQTASAPFKTFNVPGDEQGHYVLRDLPAGRYSVTASWPEGGNSSTNRTVNLLDGQELAGIDLMIPSRATTVSGKVRDENGEAVPGAIVVAMTNVYDLGVLQHQDWTQATTNDRGEYRLTHFTAGDSYLLLAKKEAIRFEASSESLGDPRLRKAELAPMYYPNSPDIQAAQTIVLQPGQNLEAVDFRMVHLPPLCAEGVAELAGAAAVELQLVPKYPETRPGGILRGPKGRSEADGKFRVCGLHPGEYRLIAKGPEPGGEELPAYGTASFSVLDEDVKKLKISAPASIPIPGDFAWDGTPPDSPTVAKMTVQLLPVDRQITVVNGKGQALGAQTSLPGEFRIPALEMGDYEVHIRGVSGGQYVKEATYGTSSVLHEFLHLGSAMGYAGLHIVVARDGATLAVQVNDADGIPVGGATVYALPASVTSEPILAAAMVAGQTDQYGSYKSGALRPGKYYVLSTRTAVSRSPEAISKLWRARLSKAKEMELGPGATVQVTLEPVTIN